MFHMFHIVSQVSQVCSALVSDVFHFCFTYVLLRNMSCGPFRSLTTFATQLLSPRLESQAEPKNKMPAPVPAPAKKSFGPPKGPGCAWC